jgi:DNA-binding SARP family transcriptional activator
MKRADPDRTDGSASVQVQLLGGLSVRRAGAPLGLPNSRKVRALMAYLALAPRPVMRTQLCELLGDVSSDPRGELRWCLSKIRGVLDEPEHARVQAVGDCVALELADCFVDAVALADATKGGVQFLAVGRLQELAGLCGGEFLAGLELAHSPQLSAWLTTQRRRFQACHVAVLEQLVKLLPAGSPEAFVVLEKWLELAALDRRAHELLLGMLARAGRIRAGEEHLAATARLFEVEGLDSRPLRDAWRAAVTRPLDSPARVEIQHSTAVLSSASVTPRRASIAVMPFVDLSSATNVAPEALAGALVHDIITRLAKLRSVAVIAQGTVFALNERGVGAEAAGRALGVDYIASGSVRYDKQRSVLMMELAEVRTARIIWTEDFDFALDATFAVLDEVGNRIVAAIAGEIEMAERNRALLKPPNSLDAWEAHHRGLWHMYRFNAADNEQAQRFFQMAVRLDPTFSRAYAGLSFTHFQNAFLHRNAERNVEMERALSSAAQGLIADERDPAAHWAMGRALWLQGEQAQCHQELARAVELSPHFALGHYTVAFVHCQSGDPQTAIDAADHSRHLSPYDPLLFAMLASRALAHVRLGQFEEGATWALNAAARPNIHVHIRAIAANCLAAASRLDEARAFVASIHKTHPKYGIADYLAAFRFADDAEALFRRQARLIGME